MSGENDKQGERQRERYEIGMKGEKKKDNPN